jgi:L-ascorbate metabolism protein UlaG (beta-lactamase superfamily)
MRPSTRVDNAIHFIRSRSCILDAGSNPSKSYPLMLRKILIGLLAIIVLGIGFIYYRTQPSGDINKYQEYFADENQSPADSNVQVTFFGVSTLLIDDGETQLLIDGFFSRYSMSKILLSAVQSDTASIDRVLTEYDISRLKGIFVTHSHYDHGFDAGYIAKKTGTPLYGSPSTLNIGRGADVSEDLLIEFQHNRDLTLGNFTVRVVPSIHSPGSALEDEGLGISGPLRQPVSFKAYLEGGSYDFLISHHGKKMYIKPSPNFIAGALDSLDVDVVFLGIATATKHDSTWTDDFYRENVKVLEPSLLVPLHWDDFFEPLSNHLVMLPRFTANVEDDFDYFIRRTGEDGIDFKILQGTRSIVVF